MIFYQWLKTNFIQLYGSKVNMVPLYELVTLHLSPLTMHDLSTYACFTAEAYCQHLGLDLFNKYLTSLESLHLIFNFLVSPMPRTYEAFMSYWFSYLPYVQAQFASPMSKSPPPYQKISPVIQAATIPISKAKPTSYHTTSPRDLNLDSDHGLRGDPKSPSRSSRQSQRSNRSKRSSNASQGSYDPMEDNLDLIKEMIDEDNQQDWHVKPWKPKRGSTEPTDPTSSHS